MGDTAIHPALVMGLSGATAGATFLGGFAAFAFHRRLPWIMGFSAGAVVALAFFDLLPEALRLREAGTTAASLLAVAAAGFYAYAILDRLVLAHHDAGSASRGWVGAGSLSVHSLTDGLALGLGFQASLRIGAIVAVAILAHDFSDGMNTVSLVVKNGGSRRSALRWLATDALAPVAGAALSFVVTLPPGKLAIVLAAFAGFFLYIGASDLLPDSFRGEHRLGATTAMLLGAGVLYVAVQLAG